MFRLIAGSGARLIGVGLVIGLLLSVGVGMGLQSLLIGIEPTDPITYAGVIGVLTHRRRRGVPVARSTSCRARSGDDAPRGIM